MSKMKYWNCLSGVRNNLTLGSTSLHSGLSVGGSGETLPARHNIHLFKMPLRDDQHVVYVVVFFFLLSQPQFLCMESKITW